MENQKIKEICDEQKKHAIGYSQTIENDLCKILEINRQVMEELEDVNKLCIDDGTIRENPFQSIKSGLFYLLANNPTKKEQIVQFLEKYDIISSLSMEDILSFTSNQKDYNGTIIDILEENGEIYINKIIEDFENIIP